MKKEDVLKQYATPTGAPAFVPGLHRFTSREYLNITYRTDKEALMKLVPEPLEVDEPLVRFEVMNMPDTTGYGSYVECGQAAVVRHGKENSEYIIGILDNLPAIAAGRELSAFPKKLGSAKLFVDSDALRSLDKVQPRMPPGVGEHSEEILKEAGLDAAAINRMRAAGAIG